MNSVSASSIASLKQAEIHHRAAIATLRVQQEMQLTAIRMGENEERSVRQDEGIGAITNRRV